MLDRAKCVYTALKFVKLAPRATGSETLSIFRYRIGVTFVATYKPHYWAVEGLIILGSMYKEVRDRTNAEMRSTPRNSWSVEDTSSSRNSEYVAGSVLNRTRPKRTEL